VPVVEISLVSWHQRALHPRLEAMPPRIPVWSMPRPLIHELIC
jgi:hypothetical protein